MFLMKQTMCSKTKRFLHCLLPFSTLVFGVTIAMTRYGKPCFDNCIKYSSHYSCYKAEISEYYNDVRSGKLSY